MITTRADRECTAGVPFSNTKLRIPSGFLAVLDGLAREVLREQPVDAYIFGARYFDDLLIIREGLIG